MTSVAGRELDLSEVLGDEPFLRRVARQLVRDEADVDDVVQQVWIEAMRASKVTRGWLRKAAVSRAHNLRRDEDLARVREQEAARPEGLPSTQELVEREEVRRRVVDAVLSLDDPYRDVVLLRYFRDLPMRQVAKALGVPRETAATRLKRAVARLRGLLDDAYDGDRRRWVVGLVPLALPAGKAAVASGSAATLVGWITNATGILAMTNKLVWAILSVAALFALGLGWSLWSDRAEVALPHEDPASTVASAELERPDPAPVETGRTATATERQVVEPADTRRADGLSASVVAGLAGIRGRLVDRSGTPVPGVRVKLAGVDPLSGVGGVRVRGSGAASNHVLDVGSGPRTRSVVSGEDGRFVFEGLLPRGRFAITVDPGGRHEATRPLDRTLAPGRSEDLGDLELVVGARVRGVVVDEAGQPLAGAEVWGGDVPGGLFSVAPIDRLDRDVWFLIAAPSCETMGALSDGELANYQGRVGKHLRRLVPIADDGDEFLVLPAAPVVAAVYDELPIRRARTDENGMFVLDAMPDGPCSVVVRSAGCLPTQRSFSVRGDGETDLGKLRIGRGEVCGGFVIDGEGRPVAGARVRFAQRPRTGLSGVLFAGEAVESGDDGSFVHTGVERGEVMLAVQRAPGRAWKAFGPFDADDDEIEIALPATAGVDLEVRDLGGEPIANARVEVAVGPPLGELAIAGLQQRWPATSSGSANGVYAIDDLEPGVYTVTIDAPGYAEQARGVQVGDDGARVVCEVVLEPAFAVTMRIVDTDAEPVEGAQVFVERTGVTPWNERLVQMRTKIGRWSHPVDYGGVSDASGRVVLEGLRKGEVAAVYVRHVRYAANVVPVSGGAPQGSPEQPVVVQLEPLGAVVGTLFDHGRPALASEYAVTARPTVYLGGMPEPPVHVRLGADGSFRIDGLRPAEYELQAVALAQGEEDSVYSLAPLLRSIRGSVFDFSGGLTRRDVTVVAGQEVDGTFELDATTADRTGPRGFLTVRAVVDGAAGGGLNLMRRVSSGVFGSKEELGTLDEAGALGPIDLPVGNHDITLYHGATLLWARDVAIGVGEHVAFDVVVDHARLSGTVTDPSGRPAVGYSVLVATIHDSGDRTQQSVETDTTGRYDLEVLAGSVRVVVSGAHGAGQSELLELGAGDVVVKDLSLSSAGVVSGRVQPAGSVEYVTLKTEQQFHAQTIGADGRFVFTFIDPGEWQVGFFGAEDIEATPSVVNVGEAGLLDLIVTARKTQ